MKTDKQPDDAQKRSFESVFAQLEEAVAQLEAGGLTLDQALEVYEQARELATWCEKKLDAAELHVQQLTDTGELEAL